LFEEARTRDYRALLEVIQYVARQEARDTPRIWLVTRGAQAVGREPLSVAQAPLWGLGRTVVHELPRLELTRIDLAPGGSAGEIVSLLSEFASSDREDEIAFRPDGRYVGRLVRRPLSASATDRLIAARGGPFQLRIDRPGVLDRLALRPLRRRAPGRGEVEIEVALASVNFIDVLRAMGVYPGQDDGSIALGGECAGRITRIGEGVHGLHVGDDVVALAPASIATHVTTTASFVVRRPAGLHPADAAAAPAAFMTAWIALHHLARMKRGERILIHSAAGGTGLAALEIASRIGAEIYATAGNDEKRAFLASRGVRLVADSRALTFADAVMDATEGRGVDVVLNSLSGEAIDRSLAIVAPYGRFVELGKRDIYNDAPLRLGHFKRCLSYFALDLAAMTADRPGETAAVLHEVIDALAAGRLTPLPRTIVPVSQAADAFRTMAGARHIGKLVIDLADPEARISVPAGLSRASGGTVLITGGLGGLGLAAARRLVDEGARRLVLVGRRGAATPQQAEAVASLERSSAEIVIAKADVADACALRQVLDAIAASGPKLCGVVHAAGVLADALLIDQSAGHYAAVAAPKIAGAWNLHALTKDTPLEFFVLYSSAASLFGAPGQGNYAAANAFLDALAHHRRAIGLPALSINWGAFSEVGLAAARDDGLTRLAAFGVRSLTPAEGTGMLARLLESDEAQVGVVPLDMRRWLSFHPRLASSPLFSELVRAAKGPAAPSDVVLVARLRAATAADRRALVEEFVIDQVAHVVRVDRSRIERSMPFKSLGIDSLMGLELRNRLESALGVRLPATLVWSYGDAEALAAYLATRLDGKAPSPAVPPAPQAELVEASSDVERRLVEKLAALRERIQ
jgi:NADPH:quinone reductase-like Zn-dependent oxidoreductase/acyl carrier protein